MRKFIQVCLSVILIFFSISFYLYANNNVSGNWTVGVYATPTVFKVKPLSMTLCESFDVTTGLCNGANDEEFSPNVVSDNGRCDIAGVAPGSVACSATGANTIPKNVTFNFMRVIISRTMWLTGTVTPVDANGGTIDWGSGGDYDGNLESCVTSSELTNTNGNSAPVGIAVSSGSACSSSNPNSSHVLKSIGLDKNYINSSIRIGIGKFNSDEHIEIAIKSITKAIERKI